MKHGLLLLLGLLVKDFTIISKQGIELILKATWGLTLESPLHYKEMLDNKERGKCNLLNMSNLLLKYCK